MGVPVITSLSAATGPSSGGDLVVLRGTGLAERVAVVAACRYVDQVVPHAPLEVSPRYLDQLDVQVVCHADDLTAAARERMYGEILATREFAWIPYTPGISTRALRERVLEADRQSSGGADASGGSRQ